MSVDVVVIGGGIAGLAVARKVARGGARVSVVDRGEPARQASWAAAGMLAPQAEAERPDDFFALLLRARRMYPALVAELQTETGIDVEYRAEGMIFAAFSEEDEEELDRRFAWQTDAGLEVERLTAAMVREIEPALSPQVRSALRFPGDHQVENRLLTGAFRVSARRSGAEILVSREVTAVRADAAGVDVTLSDSSMIRAASVVVAAGSWAGTIRGLPRPLPVEPVHGELIAVATEPGFIRHMIASSAGYLVPRSGGRLIVGTTVDRAGFRSHSTMAGLGRLTDLGLRMAPELSSCEVTSHWSGLRPGTPDGFPIIGADPTCPRVLYAAGLYRNGILLGPLTGEIVGGIALGEEVDVDLEPFRPDRF